jgi:hypothetical protein
MLRSAGRAPARADVAERGVDAFRLEPDGAAAGEFERDAADALVGGLDREREERQQPAPVRLVSTPSNLSAERTRTPSPRSRA